MRYAAVILIVYAMFAFVIAEPNPFEWDGFVRFLMIPCAIAALAFVKSLEEDNQ